MAFQVRDNIYLTPLTTAETLKWTTALQRERSLLFVYFSCDRWCPCVCPFPAIFCTRAANPSDVALPLRLASALGDRELAANEQVAGGPNPNFALCLKLPSFFSNFLAFIQKTCLSLCPPLSSFLCIQKHYSCAATARLSHSLIPRDAWEGKQAGSAGLRVHYYFQLRRIRSY